MQGGFAIVDDRRHTTIRVMRTGTADDRKREFERLYRESYSYVYNYVCYRMADVAVAEDIVAEAFMKAARAFDRFDPARAKFTTWVINIAINCMNSHYRKERQTSALEDIPESVVAVPGEQDAVADRDLVFHLLKAINEEERELVLMKYREDKRNVDIADELGMNASTVSTKLANALMKMRKAAEGVWNG